MKKIVQTKHKEAILFAIIFIIGAAFLLAAIPSIFPPKSSDEPLDNPVPELPQTLGIEDEEELTEEIIEEPIVEDNVEETVSQNPSNTYQPIYQPQQPQNPQSESKPEPDPEPEVDEDQDKEPEQDPIEYNRYISELFNFSFEYKAEYGEAISETTTSIQDNTLYLTGELITLENNPNFIVNLTYSDILGFGSGGPGEIVELEHTTQESNTNQEFHVSTFEVTLDDETTGHGSASYFNEEIEGTDNDYHVTVNTWEDIDSFNSEETINELSDIVESIELDEVVIDNVLEENVSD